MFEKERKAMVKMHKENIQFYKEQIRQAEKKIQWLTKQQKEKSSFT